MRSRHPVIGVTGLPCAGKSLAAGLLSDGHATGEKGIFLHADAIGHDVLRRPGVARMITGRFGPDVVDPDGMIDRAKVAARVFSDQAGLSWLEELVHPEVKAEVEETIRNNDGRALIALEAAPLFASGLDKLCDLVMVIEAPFEMRLKRAAARNWNENELRQRETRLLPYFTKEKLASCQARIITVQNTNNDGGLSESLAAALSKISERKVTQ